MNDEENNEAHESQEHDSSEPNESNIPDVDTSTYQEKEVDIDDIETK